MIAAMPAKKPTRGRPPGREPAAALQTRVPLALKAALDSYCDAQRIRPDTSEVLRTIIREFLEREGFWPPKQN